MKTNLYLQDGEKLTGEAIGFWGETDGEVVFSTGMSGYIESLTDPSFSGQILTFTYPLIGNYGVPKPKKLGPHLMANLESEKPWVKGVVVSQICSFPSHWESVQNLSGWLLENRIPGIAIADTRMLTRKLREHGVMRGYISPGTAVGFRKQTLPENYVRTASIKEPVTYKPGGRKPLLRIGLIDCGVKHGIIRALLANGYEVVRVPWDSDPLEIKNLDGVLCSNGPGDPKDVPEVVDSVRRIIKSDIPFLGVCLGHQLLALAIGADTYKLKYGHRGLNQPCRETISSKAYVTSQNHGYAADTSTLPPDYRPWFVNLNDGTNEGIRHITKPVMSTQFHPEGCPGPFDTGFVFGMFREINGGKTKK